MLQTKRIPKHRKHLLQNRLRNLLSLRKQMPQKLLFLKMQISKILLLKPLPMTLLLLLMFQLRTLPLPPPRLEYR